MKHASKEQVPTNIKIHGARKVLSLIIDLPVFQLRYSNKRGGSQERENSLTASIQCWEKKEGKKGKKKTKNTNAFNSTR